MTSATMNTTDFRIRPARLIHVHACVDCGSLFSRKMYEGRALTSGVFHCPNCGHEGPLNVEIRESDELSEGATS